MRSSGVLRTVGWQFITDVSGKPIGPVFKFQAAQRWITRPLKMGPIVCPEKSVRNYHPYLLTYLLTYLLHGAESFLRI